jgi:hypothetical protein
MNTTATLKQKLITRALSAAITAAAVPTILFAAAGTAQADSYDDAVNNAQTQLTTVSDAYGKAVQEQGAAQDRLTRLQEQQRADVTRLQRSECAPVCWPSQFGPTPEMQQAQAAVNSANDQVAVLKYDVLAALKARNDAVAARDQAHNH